MGDDFFKDDCHWHEEYYPLVSGTLLLSIFNHNRLLRSSVLSPSPQWNLRWLDQEKRTMEHPRISPNARYGILSGVRTIPGARAFSERAIAYFARSLQIHPGQF